MARKTNTKAKNKKSKRPKKSFTTAQDAIRAILTSRSSNELWASSSKLKLNPSVLFTFNLARKRLPHDLYLIQTQYVDFERNLMLCVMILNHHSKILSEYLKIENKITHSILKGDFEEAIRLINATESNYGSSVSMLKLKKAILISEFSEADDYLHKKSQGVIDFILTHSSRLISDFEIFDVRKKNFLRDLEKGDLTQDIKNLAIYHFLPFDSSYAYNFDSIFQYEKETSFIDIYNFINFYVFSLILSGNKSKLAISIDRLPNEGVFKDLKGVDSGNFIINRESIQINDLYIEEKYSEICDYYLENKSKLYEFKDCLIFAKAFANIGKSPSSGMLDEIISSIANLLNRGKGYKRSRLFLEHCAYKFRSLKWFRDLNYFLQSEKDFIDEFERNINKKSFLVSLEGVSTTTLNLVEGEMLDGLAKNVLDLNGDSASLIYQQIVNGCNIRKARIDKLSGFSKGFGKGLSEYRSGNYSNAITIFKSLSNIDLAYKNLELERWYLNSLIALGRIDEAIQVFVDSYLEDRDIAIRYDLKKLVDSIGDSYKNKKSINYPIIFTIYSEEVNSEFDSKLRYSLELFLSLNSYEYPQSVFFKEDKFGESVLNYFLERVCTRDRMKIYIAFDSSYQVENCRSDICEYLIKRKVATPSIVNELREINKNRVLRTAKIKVDASRIYVDSNVYYGREGLAIRQLYARYLALPDPLITEDQDYQVLYDRIVSDGEEDLLLNLHKIHVKIENPVSRKTATFHSLIGLIRDEFVHGDKGLDYHLSTRIRHGVLPSALREVLKDESLYIDLDSNPDEIQVLNRFSSLEKFKIFDALKSSVVNIEKEISRLNDQYLKVETLIENIVEKKNDRLFNYTISGLECYGLQNELSSSTSYEEFIDVALKWLWARTDNNLAKIRYKIMTEIRPSISSSLESLKVQVLEINSNRAGLEFINAIDRAKSALAIKAEVICSWFNKYEVGAEGEFDISNAIDIATKMIGIPVQVHFNELYVKIRGANLSSFVDIFATLFDNIGSKSGLENGTEDARVIFSVSKDGSCQVSISNRCKKDVVDPDRIKFYKEAYGDGDIASVAATTEGGTGFFKIWKMLEKDMEIPHVLDLYFEGDRFNVDITIKECTGVRWFEDSTS